MRKTRPFQWAPTLGGECYGRAGRSGDSRRYRFQWAPTLGGECYLSNLANVAVCVTCFNGHPPLGVNATTRRFLQQNPMAGSSFNGHPPLGVNATQRASLTPSATASCFNGHPPLGVNATQDQCDAGRTSTKFQWAPTLGGECYELLKAWTRAIAEQFQWAPTLGGECYCRRKTSAVPVERSFNGHPPLGVNATV